MKSKISMVAKWALFIIGVGCIVYAVYTSRKPPTNLENELNTSPRKDEASVAKEIPVSNVKMYTSASLGVTFQYAIKDPISGLENKVIEKGNEITTTNGGIVKIYSKSREVSLMDTLKSKMPDCSISVVQKGYGNLINKNMDIGLLVTYPDGWNGDPTFIGNEASSNYSLTEKDKKCRSQFNEFGLGADIHVFWGDSQSPDKYVGVVLERNKDPNTINGLLKYKSLADFSTWEETIKFLPKSIKTYTTDLFSVDYPGYLTAGSDNYFCDYSNCTTPPFWFFFNNLFHSDRDSAPSFEVNRVDIYPGKEITKMDLQIKNRKEIIIGPNRFIVGDNLDWLGGKAYWIQGKGYALRVTEMVPKQNPQYNGHIDLASLKLK